MRKLSFVIVILQCCLLATAQQSTTKINATSVFDTYIQHAMPLWKTPGLSVAVVKDGQVVFEKGYGVRELGKPAAFDTSTISICASTTKAMTAVCLGMLVDEGKIKWTDKVSDVYPELKLYDNYANSEMTIKDLLTHNTGLGNADMLWEFDASIDTIIHQMRYLHPAYSFRSSFIYQNLMYIVAGEVIHKVSGKQWDEFITERLFKSLGMNNTYASYQRSTDYSDRITPHYMYEDSVVKPIPYIDSKTIDAAGGVWSCAKDINKWMMFLLDSAKVNGKRLLQPETFAMLFKPASIVTESQFYPTAKLTNPHWTTYGLGWFQEDYGGKMVQFHTGSLDGAVAIIGLIPDAHFGIYVFANMDHTEIRHALMYKAMDLWALNDNTNDWSTSFYSLYTGLAADEKKKEKETEAKRVLNTKPSLSLSGYTGKYTSELYGNASIVLQGDSLVLQLPNHINAGLSHWHFDTFQAKFERQWYGKAFLQFILNTNGEVSGFTFMGMNYEKKE